MTSNVDVTAAEIGEVIAAGHMACDAAEPVLRGGRGGSVALMLLVIASLQRVAREACNLLGMIGLEPVDPAQPVEARLARVPRASGEHRHKFVDNVCVVAGCGKVKSPNGRKPAGEVAPPADTRTLPIPGSRPLGDAAADWFTDGGQGSSGVARR